MKKKLVIVSGSFPYSEGGISSFIDEMLDLISNDYSFIEGIIFKKNNKTKKIHSHLKLNFFLKRRNITYLNKIVGYFIFPFWATLKLISIIINERKEYSIDLIIFNPDFVIPINWLIKKYNKRILILLGDHVKERTSPIPKQLYPLSKIVNFYYNFSNHLLSECLSCVYSTYEAKKYIGFIFQLNQKSRLILTNKILPLKVESLGKSSNLKKEDNDNDILFCFVGRLHPQKDPLYLIKEFGKIIKYHPNSKLDIYGDGPLKNLIIDYVKKQKLETHISIKGFVPRNELLRLLPVYDYIILPYSEGFGIGYSALEALCSGLILLIHQINESIIRMLKEDPIVGIGFRIPEFGLFDAFIESEKKQLRKLIYRDKRKHVCEEYSRIAKRQLYEIISMC